jgi:tetratricopeptide (TPR) repeat protein
MNKNAFQKPIVHILLIIILSLLAYANSFNGEFHYDDKRRIIRNPLVKDLGYFVQPSRAEEIIGSEEYGSLKRRFAGYLSFALNYRMHGLDVTGYHIVNVIIHIINGILVYALIVLSFRTPFLNRSSLQSKSRILALFGSLLFVSHPIQTQAVTYIVQRFASLATLFYLLSLVAYVKWRLMDQVSGQQKGGEERRSGNIHFRPFFPYAVSVFSAIVAMKTKEIAFTLPVTILLYEFMFFKGKKGRRIVYLLPLLLTLVIIPFSLTGVDKPVGELIGDVGEKTIVAKDLSRWDYLITEFRVLVTYMRLIFAPFYQNLDYDYPIYRSLFNAEVILSLLFHLFLFSAAVYLLYRSNFRDSTLRLVSFGIFWFFITLSVESSFIPLQAIYEHRMYLPSVGVFMAIIAVLFIVVERLRGKWLGIEGKVIGTLVIIVVVLTGMSYARNKVWQTGEALWKDVIKKSPKKARGYFNLGNSYRSHGKLVKAVEHYKIAIELDPDITQFHSNLAVTYEQLGRMDEAIEQYRIAIRLDPEYPPNHINLGQVYKSRGLITEAIEQYEIAAKLTPDNPQIFSHLGVAYYTRGRLDEAIKHFEKTIRLKPDYPYVHSNLGNVYLSRGFVDKAIEELKYAIKVRPDNVRAHYDLSIAYKSKGRKNRDTDFIDKAIEHLLRVVNLNPKHIKAYYDLGVLYHLRGLSDKAIENYKTASRLKPDWSAPHYNLAKLYFQMGDKEKGRREMGEVARLKLLSRGILKNP